MSHTAGAKGRIEVARRRMLSTRISLSKKINHVSDQAALLYTWMIPHLDELGLMEADPEIVKAQVVPLRDTFSDEVVEDCLEELSAVDAIIIYQVDGNNYLHYPNFHEFQTLKNDRVPTSEYPIPPWISIKIDNLSDGKIKVQVDTSGRPRNTLDSNGFHRKAKDKIREDKVREDKRRIFLVGTEAFRLSELLYSLILQNNPKAKKPDLKKWAQTIDRMIRLDERDPQEIEAVIRWCQADDFWYANILSADKLRKQYDQLILKMGQQLKRRQPKGIEGIVALEELGL
ncbi:MAG: hypothetical protein WC072_08995 [Methanoregulaceae archaeon]